jgi:hypothetical protein
MNRPAAEPGLFADGPARDARFDVKERWIECTNLPVDDPAHVLEFFHRQMNEEVTSIENSARNLVDFPEVEWSLRMFLARQCADEARHAKMFRRLYESRGGVVGAYPVLNFQYRIVSNCPTLIGRLTIQNRSFEAGGIDAIAVGIGEARDRGDEELAAVYEAQLADEIIHVRFANEWITAQTQRDPRNILKIGAALTAAAKAFAWVMGPEGTEGVSYPAAGQERLEAGFTPNEIKRAAELAGTAAGE